MILTMAHSQDLHAYVVQDGLREKGFDMTFWHCTDLAQRQRVNLEISDASDLEWSITDRELDLGSEAPGVIWLRRPERPIVGEEVHPSDRKWAAKEYEEMLLWLLHQLPRDAFWINEPMAARRARSKIEQARVARQVGMHLPRSLFSNDPERIRAFLRAQGGKIIYKGFQQQGPWVLDDYGFAYLYTAVLDESMDVSDDTLRAAPGIYQEIVPKAYELRVTVIGEHIFPVKIDSQATKSGRLDWRLAHHEISCEPTELPAELYRAIGQLMSKMGLTFGAMDFIVTPDGRHVFLEVNEAGQFLFAENDAGIPLLDAFCEMLIQGRPDFRWRPEDATIHYGDLADAALARKEEDEKDHCGSRGAIAGKEPKSERPMALSA